MGIPKVEDAFDPFFDQDQYVEDTIQNGVKHTEEGLRPDDSDVEDTIQNGVKHTNESFYGQVYVEDTIQNGIKDTKSMCGKRGGRVGNTIQNGVKETHDDCSNNIARVEGIVRICEKLN